LGLFSRWLAFGRAPRGEAAEAGEGDGAARERAPAPRFRESEPEPPLGEFDVFLADMGATPVAPEVSKLAVRDATIAELRESLEKLRPLGDQLAATERARLTLSAELDEARAEVARLEEEHRAQIDVLETELGKVERARGRLEERVTKLRAKFTRRDRVASERWHQIRELKKERRELRERLEVLQNERRPSPVDLAGPPPARPAPDLRSLFAPEGQAEEVREAPPAARDADEAGGGGRSSGSPTLRA